MLDHKGKVAIVTGGAQGIGRGITDVLAEMELLLVLLIFQRAW